MQDQRDYKRDIQIFQKSPISRPPKTVRTFIAAVKSFFVENDIEFSNKFWRRISRRINGTHARTLDKVPSTTRTRHRSLQSSVTL